MDKIYFARTNEDAIIPTKRIEDGCYDIYACFKEDEIIINPHEIKLIPTGVATSMSSDYRISVRERGSNTKTGLIVMAGQIDSGYRGEIFVALYNATNRPVYISKNKSVPQGAIHAPYNKAIAQLAVEFVPQVETETISYEELLTHKSERGLGKLGSSNK